MWMLLPCLIQSERSQSMRRVWGIWLSLVLGFGAALAPPLAGVQHGVAAVEQWSPTGGLSAGRRDHALTLLADGRVLVTGGRRSAGITTTVELYNPASGSWSITGSLTHERFDHSATLLA